MITAIDATAAEFLHKISDAAQHAIARENGLVWVPARGVFNPTDGTFNIKGSFKLATVGGKSREQFEFERDVSEFGLKPEHYKVRFMRNTEEYELLGFELRRKRFPIRCLKVSDGKSYCLPDDALDAIPGRTPGDFAARHEENMFAPKSISFGPNMFDELMRGVPTGSDDRP